MKKIWVWRLTVNKSLEEFPNFFGNVSKQFPFLVGVRSNHFWKMGLSILVHGQTEPTLLNTPIGWQFVDTKANRRSVSLSALASTVYNYYNLYYCQGPFSISSGSISMLIFTNFRKIYIFSWKIKKVGFWLFVYSTIGLNLGCRF